MDQLQDNFRKKYSNTSLKWTFWDKQAFPSDNEKPYLFYITHLTSRNSKIFDQYLFSDPLIKDYIEQEFSAIIINKNEFPEVEIFFQTSLQATLNTHSDPMIFVTQKELIPLMSLVPQEFSEINEKSFLTKLQQAKDLKTQDNFIKISQQALSHPKISESKKIKFPGEFPGAQSIIENYQEVINDDLENKGSHLFNFSFYEWVVEQILEGVVDQKTAESILNKLEVILSSSFIDHIRGGCFKYCLDKNWSYPQFEKVLTRQSAYLKLISKLSIIYPSPILFDSILETLDYLEQEMLHEKNFFMNSQDSSSEGIEGLYFNFTEEEFEDALKEGSESLVQKIDKVKTWFAITKEGDLEDGLNILRLDYSLAKEFLEPTHWDLVRETKELLLKARSERIPPVSDNSGVASWNFDMIVALCDVIQYSKIQIIKDKAIALMNKVLDSIHSTFFAKSGEKKTTLNHSSTFNNEITYFEDYVSFIDAQTRLYETTGRVKFMDNALMSIDFVLKEFLDNSCFLSRQKESQSPIQNIHSHFFDKDFRSSSSRFLALIRKWSLVKPELSQNNQLKEMIENLKQFALHSPLFFGEGLRAVTYPEAAYKHIQVPRSWVKDSNFLQLKTYLSYRFLIEYTDSPDSWKILQKENVEEMNGVGLEEFKNYLTGKK